MNPRIALLLSVLGASLLAGCQRGEAPSPLGPDTPARDTTAVTEPMLLVNPGLAHLLTTQPDGVGTYPSLYQLDESRGQVTELLQPTLAAQSGDLAARDWCELSLSGATAERLTFVAKYDFTARGNGSRLLTLDRRTMQIVGSQRFREPQGDEWVRASFTLSDGTTYLNFGRRSNYRLDPATGQMQALQPSTTGWLAGAAAWGERGYFFPEESNQALRYTAGSVASTPVPLFVATPGEQLRNVYRAGGEWMLLRAQSGRVVLHSLATDEEIPVSSSVAVGNSCCYDARSRTLYFASSGSDALQRSVYRLVLPAAGAPEQAPELVYRVSGQTEADNRQGLQISLGVTPSGRSLVVTWLDEGRASSALASIVRLVILPMNAASLPWVPQTNLPVRGAVALRYML